MRKWEGPYVVTEKTHWYLFTQRSFNYFYIKDVKIPFNSNSNILFQTHSV